MASLKDFLVGFRVELKEAHYSNDLKDNSIPLNLDGKDSLQIIGIENELLISEYERQITSQDGSLRIRVILRVIAKIRDERQNEAEEIKKMIEENRNDFIAVAASEASLIIANLTKSAGFLPLITQPAFME